MVKRSIAAILVVTMMPQLTGCTVWRVQQVSPAQAILQTAADSQPHDVRVRLRGDNGTLVIQKAGIVGDSIVGSLRQDSRPPRRVAVALGDVQEVAVSEVSAGRSLLALGVAAVAVGVIAAAISIGSWHMGGVSGGRW